MTGKIPRLALIAAVLTLLLPTLVIPTEPSSARKATPRPSELSPQKIKTRHHPTASTARVKLKQVGSSYRSAAILDDARGRQKTAATQASPGMAFCTPGTAHDLQHLDLGHKQIATLGGDPNSAIVHFAWSHWEVIPESLGLVDRFVNYNGYDPAVGFCASLGCGWTISGGDGDPLLARAGFISIDVMSDDYAVLFFHQRDEQNQSPSSPQIYSSFVLSQGIPCFFLFAEDQMPGSADNEIIWPHGRVDRSGDPASDVFHVCAHPSGDVGMGDEIVYWRRVGFTGPWEGPSVLDINAGGLSYDVAVDPTSSKVAVIYTQDQTPGNVCELFQVVYMESPTNGSDWIAAGAPAYPTPVTDLGFDFNQVTAYSDPAGTAAWLEPGGEYDFDGELHVFWIEQVVQGEPDARCKHWSASTGISTVAQAIDWDNQGGWGERDLWLASPGIAFGDGQTYCSDGPVNPGSGGTRSNRNYVYYVYEQYGGPLLVEQADVSAAGHMNLEVYLATSNDGGATWSPPANLTDTRTPGCDGTPGDECASERDPSVALVVNDAIHILYILDTDAGDAVFGQGSWTYNPVMYYRIPGGTDAEFLCPEIGPSFYAWLLDADPGCEYHAAPGGLEVEGLFVENFGNATMNGEITTEDSFCPCEGSEPPTWLTVIPDGPYTIEAGEFQFSTVTMDATGLAEGLHQACICITHTDPSLPSPQCIPIDFFVLEEFCCPEYAILRTGSGGKSLSDGVLWLEVGNTERFANQYGSQGGLARLNSDPTVGDSSCSIYDGSLLIGVPPNPDTLVYRNIYGAGNGQPGFRALSSLEIDGGAYGSNAGYTSAFAHQTTIDSSIGIDVTYLFPQNQDSSEFVLIRYEIFNRTGSTIHDLVVGVAADLDVTPGPDSLRQLQSGANNTGHLRTDYNLVYQQGADSADHVIIGPSGREVTATRFKGGMTAIMCDEAPRAWIAPNNPWLYSRPGSGFHEGYLYSEMLEADFELLSVGDPDQGEDLHSVVVFDQDVDLPVSTREYYCLGLVSSNTGTDEDDLINTTKKAWKSCFGWWEFVGEDVVGLNTATSYPYYASGSHELGWESGCCGCRVTKLNGPPELYVGGGEPGGCTGTIHFAGGENPCDFPYEATFMVRDVCGTYADLATITIYCTEPCECDCPYQGDYDADGFLTALDLGSLIDVLFGGVPDVTDFGCPNSRGDLDCDMFVTALDLSRLIDHLFAGGLGPCDPC